ncbi:hypothetical protein V6N13_061845 [Hibiscus sabdariffa]|uniref:Uncharacterized protein n=2 Tax=Hibiscus sabdariffa TaxID=183260 RepID=A0ABR2NJU4_9ROSI
MEDIWHGIRHEGGDVSVVHMLRVMKGKLKQWNQDPFGNVDSNYQALVNEIDRFDERLNGDELDDCELLHKRQLYSKLWAASRLRESV